MSEQIENNYNLNNNISLISKIFGGSSTSILYDKNQNIQNKNIEQPINNISIPSNNNNLENIEINNIISIDGGAKNSEGNTSNSKNAKSEIKNSNKNTESNSKLKVNPKSFVAESMYFQKINILFVVLFFSILLAVTFINFPDIMKLFIHDDDPDSNFDDITIPYMQRWKKIIRITISLIVLIIVFHLIIFMLIVLSIALYNYSKNENFSLSFKIALLKLKEMAWEYTDSDGYMEGLISYWLLLFVVLIIMFLFYMLYTLIVKGYFTNIYFEKILNIYNPDVKDRTQPQKYSYQYSVYILSMMIFVLLLLNYTKLSNKKIIFMYNVFFILIYIVLTINILRLKLQRRKKDFIIYLGLFTFIFLIYKYPLYAIAKYLL